MKLKNKIRELSEKLSPRAVLTIQKGLQQRIESRLTEMAIEKAKIEITKRGLKIENLSKEELELFVSEEREQILSQIKNRSIGAVLLMLGIQVV